MDDLEAAAEAICNHWQFRNQVGWMPGGNSNKQNQARGYAQAAIDTLKSRGWTPPKEKP